MTWIKVKHFADNTERWINMDNVNQIKVVLDESGKPRSDQYLIYFSAADSMLVEGDIPGPWLDILSKGKK